jgi:hypothetical protein
LPANADNSEQVSALSSVSCPTSVACTAVGDYEVGGAGVAGDVLTLGGGSWQSAMAPAPGKLSPTDVGLTLSSVACPTQPTCNASGTFDNPAGYTQGVLETAKPTG